MPTVSVYDVRSHKIVSDINLEYPVLRSRERALKIEIESNLFSLFDWPSVIVNLCAAFLVGEVKQEEGSTIMGLSFGRKTGEADLIRLLSVNRYCYRSLRAHPVWWRSSFASFAPQSLGRYSKAFYTRDIARFINGARRAYKLLDLFTSKGCGARARSTQGISFDSLQRAQKELGCEFPASLVACMMLQHSSTVPWSPQQGAWGDGGDDNELEGSGGMALLPLEDIDEVSGARKFDGYLGDIVAMTLSKRRDGSLPMFFGKNGERVQKMMIAIGVTRTYPSGSMLWVDCAGCEMDEEDEDAGGVYECRPLLVRHVARNFVEYLFQLTA